MNEIPPLNAASLLKLVNMLETDPRLVAVKEFTAAGLVAEAAAERLAAAAHLQAAGDLSGALGLVQAARADIDTAADDAAERVEIGYEPLPVLSDPIAAGETGAPVLYPAWGDNVAVHFRRQWPGGTLGSTRLIAEGLRARGLAGNHDGAIAVIGVSGIELAGAVSP